MTRSRPPLPLLLFVSVLIGSCVGGDTPTDVGEASLAIPIQPALIPSPADGGALPINRIRARVARVADDVAIANVSIDVNPTAAQWEVLLNVPVPPGGTSVMVYLQLINSSGSGESVEFSGLVGPLALAPRQRVEPTDVPIVRGPLANYYVTGVSITTAPDTLLEGQSASLSAAVTTTAVEVPRVYWTVLDSAVLSSVDSTVTGVAPGTGRLVASAGSFTDTMSVVVEPAPAAVLVTPDTAFVVAPGDQTTFTAVVVDVRGDTVPGETVTWRSATPAVVTSLGAGLFEGVTPGVGTVEAVSASNPSLVGQAHMVVGNPPVNTAHADVALSKTVSNSQPLQDSIVTFTVAVTNLGPDTATNVVVFDTLSAVFLSPSSVVTAGSLVGDSLWTLPVLAAGDTARWTTTVTIAPNVAGGSASNRAFVRSLAELDTVAVNDTALVTMSFPISGVPTVTISTPADSAVFDPGVLVTFLGVANDPEQGDLTPAIQWTSSLDGAIGTGRTFGTSTMSTGVHQIVASVTDADGGLGADTIQVTIALITTPPTLNVPFGGTASLPIALSEPAQAGGLTLTVVSSDPAIVRPTAGTVFIAGGALSTNSTLEGLVPGTADVTVSHPQFGSAVTTVSVTAELNITATTLTVPNGFPQPIVVRLQSGGGPIAAPAGGVPVTVTPVNPACVVGAGSFTIAGGLVEQTTTLSYGGSATIPCSSYVRVTSPNLQPDSVNVTVAVAPSFNVTAATVGAGLQYGTFSVGLQTANHGGLTVRLTSEDPATMLVSPSATTPGTAFFDTFVPNGSSFVNYMVQGVEGTTGTASLVASAPGFAPDSALITVVQPAFDISGVPTSLFTLSPDDAFWVRLGVPNGQLTGLQINQAVRAGGQTFTATVTSSVPTVGDLVTLPDSASPVTVLLQPGDFNSGTSVASGGVALEPIAAGTTVVSATIPGFIQTGNGTVTVTVTQPGINVSAYTVGSGLQYGTLYATLGASDHGGVTVRLTSSDPSVMLVSPDATTAGTAFIDVVVPQGQTSTPYFAHGVEGQTGVVPLTVTAPGFSDGTANVTVVQAGFDMVGLNATTSTLTVDDPFYIRTGVPNGQQTGLQINQAVRAGASPLTVTLSSSDVAIADLVTLPDSASPVTVQIAAGAYNSPTSVASGGVALEPVGAGTVDVTASIAGLIPLNATQTVTISAPTISLNPNLRVGSGLQYGLFSASLSATDHGGVTVRLQSGDSGVLLVSPNATTAGTPFIDVVVPAGQSSVLYYVQGVEGATGTIALTASAPGFTTNAVTVDVVQPAVDIITLLTSTSTLAPNDPFQVRVGVPTANLTGMQIEQPVRAGGVAKTVTLTSSNTQAGRLVTQSLSGSSVTVPVAPQVARSPSSVALGGVEFDALGNGATTVAASIPGFAVIPNATQVVNVTTPAITVQPYTVGAGLQYGTLNAVLGATNHGGVTVTLTSLNPSVLLLSPNGTTAGTASIQVAVPNGSSTVSYWIQGVEGATGTPLMTVTANGFTDGSNAVTVVTPGLDLVSLNNSYASTAADDLFQVRVGVPLANDTGLSIVQSVRAGGPTFTATVTSSDPTAARLTTGVGTGASAQVQIVPGQNSTPTTLALGGVFLDPLAAGSTLIEATIPGVTTTTTGGRKTVTITP